MKYKILSLSFLLFLFLQCSKKKDYREKYIGNYYFSCINRIYNAIDSTTTDSTTYYNGTIAIGNFPETIIIHYLPNEIWEVDLGEDNSLTEFGSALGVPFYGKFESYDKLTFTVYRGQTDGYYEQIVTGTKQ